MLTRRQWLQAGAATLASNLYQGGVWAQDGGSVIAARFGSLPARPGRVFASGPPRRRSSLLLCFGLTGIRSKSFLQN